MSGISLDAFKELDEVTARALLKCIEEFPWEFQEEDIDFQTASMYLKIFELLNKQNIVVDYLIWNCIKILGKMKERDQHQ